jgi:hypothetical protein
MGALWRTGAGISFVVHLVAAACGSGDVGDVASNVVCPDGPLVAVHEEQLSRPCARALMLENSPDEGGRVTRNPPSLPIVPLVDGHGAACREDVAGLESWVMTRISRPARAMRLATPGPQPRPLARLGPGADETTGLSVAAAGRWTLRTPGGMFGCSVGQRGEGEDGVAVGFAAKASSGELGVTSKYALTKRPAGFMAR